MHGVVACFGSARFAHAYGLSDKAAPLSVEAERCAEVTYVTVCSVKSMQSLATNSMHEAYRPCMTSAPRQPLRASERVFHHSIPRQIRQCRHRRCCCRGQQANIPQQAEELQGLKPKLWPSLGVLSPLAIHPTASRADEVTTAAGDAAQAAAKATADLPPTVTFGGSFGQYDPIVAFFFYAVIATLTVLTLGVCHFCSATRMPCQCSAGFCATSEARIIAFSPFAQQQLPEGLRLGSRSYAGFQ